MAWSMAGGPVGAPYVMAEAAHREVQEETPELSAASKVVALRADCCEKLLCRKPLECENM
jgi:hypothetical protein